jgi:hypothetical protein
MQHAVVIAVSVQMWDVVVVVAGSCSRGGEIVLHRVGCS